MAALSLRRVALVNLAVVFLSLAASAQSASVPLYDIVIRNGHLLDGAGNPAIRADVAIKGGRFARIGIVIGRGRQEIDATGKYVSPGWVDMMDQSGAALVRNGLAENKLQAGVTTAIGAKEELRFPPTRFRSTSRPWSDRGSASISEPTSARRKHASPCWVRRTARPIPTNWRA